MEKGFTWRKLFNTVHLWLGLASGLVLFVVCLTGTIFTFHTEVEEMLEPEKYKVEMPVQGVALSPSQLVAQLQQSEKGKVTAIQIPADKAKPYRFTLKKEEAKAGAPAVAEKPKPGGGGGRGTTYLVNQYTGQVKGTTDGPAKEFFHGVEQMHRFLLVEAEPGETNIGKVIVGASTIMFVFILLSGIFIWFPKKLKNWKQGLTIKTSGNWKRWNHDLHNSLGFYSFIFLLVMSLTGLCWSFDWYRAGASAVLGDEIFKGRTEKPLQSNPVATGTKPLEAQAYVQVATRALPKTGNIRIQLPADSAAAVVVTKSQSGFFAAPGSDKVQLDQYTGAVLRLEKFEDKAFNEKITASVKALHVGEIFGTFSKIIYFLACLVATTLPVTGTLIWWNKRQKKAKKKKLVPVRPAAVSR